MAYYIQWKRQNHKSCLLISISTACTKVEVFIISYLDHLPANWCLLVPSHNLLSIWPLELSETQDCFVFSGSYFRQNESKCPQMAFLVSTFNSCSTFQGRWGSRCSHMQIIATPRLDPGSGGSEPFQFHPLRLTYPSPSSNGLHHCQGFNLIETSSLRIIFY